MSNPLAPKKRFRKTPIAWLQMTREKMRLAVALTGITFANVLMFVQLGFKDALYNSSVRPHHALRGDLFIVNPQFDTFFNVPSFSKARLYQTLGIKGVDDFSVLYAEKGIWKNPVEHTDRPILVFGIDPINSALNLQDVTPKLHKLKKINQVFFDEAGRVEYGPIANLLKQSTQLETEVNEVRTQVSGIFSLGASFVADGNIITSDSTFFLLFPNRSSERVDVGVIRIEPNADLEAVRSRIIGGLPNDVDVLTLEQFSRREQIYWAKVTPIGFVFGFGSIIGFFVGAVIVYQILYSDVSDHLEEYATLKAIGYTDSALLIILLQEALFLAILGFIPGITISTGLYHVAKGATRLPVIMTLSRAVFVLSLTILMCVTSGVFAMRKLRLADPADIF